MDKPKFLLPSAFDQMEELLAGDPNLSTSTVTASKGEEGQLDHLEPEDIMPLVEFPFDAAAIASKYEGFGLSPEESAKLARLWNKPLKRLLGKVKNADVVIAGAATLTFFMEKSIEYKIFLNNKNSTRDTGNGENERAQEST